MAEQTIFDQLNTNVDSYETKVLNATTINSFRANGPDGIIVFDSAQSSIPGFIADTASLAFTASTAPLYLPLAGGTITGNLTVNGTTTLNRVISVTSSYSSGSTIFGDALNDTHQFTGSVFITGSSVTWNNSTLIASNVTGSMSVASASQALTASYFNGTVTSASYASTASLALRISASSINSNNNTLYGSSNIESINWNIRTTYDTSNIKSINWDDRALFDNSGTSIVSWVSGSLIGTGSLQGTSSWAVRALTASYVNNLNQVVTIGNITSTPSNENTLNIYPPQAGGTGEGGQILLAASGGLYSSASMLDTWQNYFRILRGTNTGGSNAQLLGLDLQTGNLSIAGALIPSAWTTGQVIKDTMLSNTEVTVSTTTIATSGTDTDFVTYSYTPVSSNSYLIIHYHLASYDFSGGTGNDSYISRIKVDGGEITYGTQSTVNGNRTGVLFPLTGRYTNSNTTTKSIVVACRRNSADDSITIVNSSTSMWLRITEIAR
jgi:hypothetical protein